MSLDLTVLGRRFYGLEIPEYQPIQTAHVPEVLEY
jgi:hypothetical protein